MQRACGRFRDEATAKSARGKTTDLLSENLRGTRTTTLGRAIHHSGQGSFIDRCILVTAL